MNRITNSTGVEHMAYPERPPKLRPKKPRKGQGRPSSEHISGRRKSWLSAREKVDNRGNDTGARSGQPWWKSPLMKQERLKRAASRRHSPGLPA